MTIFDPPARIIIPGLWLAWAICWAVAALYAKPVYWRESFVSQALHIIPLVVCAVLLTAPRSLPPMLTARIMPAGEVLVDLSEFVVAVGLGLAVWARWHLGRNWSGTVTLKKDHVLICTGPYRVVRHPIYTGLLLAFVGTAAAIGQWRGVLAVACALTAFLWKIRVEEQRMRQTFHEYEQYRKRTAALIPLLY